MAMSTGISRAPCRKRSILVFLYTTVLVLCISQVTYDVTANETTAVQDTVPDTQELPNSSTTSDPGRPDDVIEESTSGTEENLGFYKRYKRFVAKHNKTFTIVFGVLFVISLVVAIAVYVTQEQQNYLPIPMLLGVVVFGIILYKLYGHKVMDFFRGKKAPEVKDTTSYVIKRTA